MEQTGDPWPQWTFELNRSGAPGEPLNADGTPAFSGSVELQLMGEDPEWTHVMLHRHARPLSDDAPSTYPGRPDAPSTDPGRPEGTSPILRLGLHLRPNPMAEVALPDWSAVEHPPADDDGPVVLVHVIRFAASHAARREMARYHAAALEHAVPRGVRALGWFDVTHHLAGDERRWDQVRLNAFPSRAALMSWALDPARIEANADREGGIADTYALLCAPASGGVSEPLA